MECQKCRKFPITVLQDKLFKECAPLYDEECSTTYQQHCKTTRKCTQIYQTVCHKDSGYHQSCSQVPAQTCYPETVCHKTPDTKCYPTRSQKCSTVRRNVPVQVESHQCLPFQETTRPHPTLDSQSCSGRQPTDLLNFQNTAPLLESYGTPVSNDQYGGIYEAQVSSNFYISDQNHQRRDDIGEINLVNQALNFMRNTGAIVMESAFSLLPSDIELNNNIEGKRDIEIGNTNVKAKEMHQSKVVRFNSEDSDWVPIKK